MYPSTTSTTSSQRSPTLISSGKSARLLLIFGLLVVVLSECVTANPTHHSVFLKRDLQEKFCGQRLADALNHLCRGRYNKRSDNSEEGMNEFQGEEDWQGIEPSQYRYDYSRISSPDDVGFVRRRRQIIDECCKRPCSLATLQQYCE